MLKAEKEQIVAELAERLKSTQTLFVADYRGLSVTEIDELHTKLIEKGARFTVVKNTLTRRAAEAAGSEALLALLEGPTAIAFIEANGDMVAVAKALADSARTTKVLTIRGGILDGAPIGEEEVKNLATLPPLDVLRGQVLGAITAPLTTVVGLISAPIRELVGLIDARIDQLKAQGDAAVDDGDEAKAAVDDGDEAKAAVDDGDEAKAVAVAAEELTAEVATEEPVAEVAAEEPVIEETEPEAPAEEPAATAETETETQSEEAGDAAPEEVKEEEA